MVVGTDSVSVIGYGFEVSMWTEVCPLSAWFDDASAPGPCDDDVRHELVTSEVVWALTCVALSDEVCLEETLWVSGWWSDDSSVGGAEGAPAYADADASNV